MIVRLSEVPVEERHLLAIADLEAAIRGGGRSCRSLRPRLRIRAAAPVPAAPPMPSGRCFPAADARAEAAL